MRTRPLVLPSGTGHPSASGLQAGLRYLGAAWRSVRGREIAWFALFGAFLAGVNLLALADPAAHGRDPDLRITQSLAPLLAVLLLILAWLPADRSAVGSPWRIHRLSLAVLVASVVAAGLIQPLAELLGLPTTIDEAAYRAKGKVAPSPAALFAAEMLFNLAHGALLVTVLELAGRRRRSEQAIDDALGEHARLSRAALESRLAAMQAQVEPRFLFDVLVDIERLYREADHCAGAAAQMERLITYLRVALPKLRDSGSTLGAEFALVASYLDLVQAMRHGRPRLRTELPPSLGETTFHPMLLLPLVQRALRDPALTPHEIGLEAARVEHRLRLRLTITAPDQCRDDAELARLRERLHILYDGRAVLHCEEHPSALPGGTPHSVFTLELPP